MFHRNQRAYRKPRSHSFSKRHDVGYDLVVIAAERFSRPSESGNHFVGEQQGAVFMRDISYVAEKSRRRHDVAGRSLDRLDYDRGRASANFFFDHAP